jgi:MFS family permease
MRAPPRPEPPTAAVAEAPSGRFAALSSPNFRILWSGLLVTNAGAQVQNVAQAWLVLQLTDSPLALGLLALSFAAPMIALPLLGGAVADRVDRITLLKVTQTVQLAVRLGMAGLVALGWLELWMLYLGYFATATLLAFDNPARQALLPGLVPRRDLLSATSLNSVVFTGAQLVGPALGGFLLPLLGPAWLFAIAGLSTLAALAATFRLRDVSTRFEGRAEPLAERLVGGLRFAARHRTVQALLGMSACLSLLVGFNYTLLPVFARDHWGAGPEGYGILAAAPGAGALIGAFGTAALGDVPRKDRLALLAGLAFCPLLVLFATVPPFPLGVALMVAAGVASAVFYAMLATLLQLRAPGNLRGRVMSLYAITVIGISSLGGLLGGAAAEAVGAPLAVTLGALGAVLVVLLLSRVVQPDP